MTKEDYKEKVEELRQEIELEDTGIKRSRASRHGKPKTKKQKNPLMTLLVFIFILIPLGILFYVWFLFEPEAPNEAVSESDDKGVVVEIQKQPSADPEAKAPVENEEKPAAADDEAAKQAAAAEEAKKAEEAEVKKAEEAQKAAAAKLEEQKRLAAEQAAAAEEAKKAQQATQAASKSHTVSSTDNLYRIALKYYGNGSAEYVDKIKRANGLTSDSISAGQVLMIP